MKDASGTNRRISGRIVSALLGAQFPLIAHFGVEPDARAGQRVSFLYGANIVGSTFGTEQQNAVAVAATFRNLAWASGPVAAGFAIAAGGPGRAYAIAACLFYGNWRYLGVGEPQWV